MNNQINIAIDGPAASGKSAAAFLLAKKIDYTFMDTGVMYRSFTFWCMENKIDLTNEEALIKVINSSYNIKWDGQQFLVNEKPVSDMIYTSEITVNVPKIARITSIRKVIVKQIQEIVKSKGFIVVGRDITSIVLPDAELKIFLTSSLEARASRRFKQFQQEGASITKDEIYNDMAARDESDQNRDYGQLMVTKDAIVLDNSDNTLEETVDKLYDIFLTKFGDGK